MCDALAVSGFPTARDLAEFTLAQQHPISLGWQPADERLARLAAEHEMDVQLGTDLNLAERRRDQFAPGQPVEVLLNRWEEPRAGLQVMLSPRYEGGDPDRPFVDVSASTEAIREPVDIAAVADLSVNTFRPLGPHYLRWWTATRLDDTTRGRGGVASDKRFLAAPIETLADAGLPTPSQLELRRATDLDHYADAVAAYQAVDQGHPDHRRQAAVETYEDMLSLTRDGTVFDVVLDGAWVGYVAVEAGHKLGLAGYKVAELVLTPAARGHGYGRYLTTLLSRELVASCQPDSVLIGTVHAHNVGALRAAHRAGPPRHRRLEHRHPRLRRSPPGPPCCGRTVAVGGPLNGTHSVPRLGRGPLVNNSVAAAPLLAPDSRSMALRDYEAWLNRYEDPSSPLSWRLALIQGWLRSELDERAGNVSVVSACAGDGRDIIDVLAARDDADRVSAVLLESHPGVADRAQARAARSHLNGVTVRTCDAADTTNYVDAVPADVVLMVGMFGNMSHEDVFTTIAATPQFCASGAALIWSRGRDRDDINSDVRSAFAEAGFTELDYQGSDQRTLPAAGIVRYEGPAASLVEGRRLFTFWR